jgi:hypothetical protein
MRNKRRFSELFRRRLWWQLWHDEYGHSAFYDSDGAPLYDSDAERREAVNRKCRRATQYANEIAGSIE